MATYSTKDIYLQRATATQTFEEYPLEVHPNRVLITDASENLILVSTSSFIAGTGSIESASVSISSSYSDYSNSSSYSISCSYAYSASFEIEYETSSSFSETSSWTLNSLLSTQALFATQSIYCTQSIFTTQSIYAISASWASASISSSYAENANIVNNATSSITASFSITASHLLGNHNNLNGLQGGTNDEYYHLNNVDYIRLNSIRIVSTNYNITLLDKTIVVTGSSEITVTLPTASLAQGLIFILKNRNLQAVYIRTANNEFIDDSLTLTSSFINSSIQLQCSGSGWFIL